MGKSGVVATLCHRSPRYAPRNSNVVCALNDLRYLKGWGNIRLNTMLKSLLRICVPVVLVASAQAQTNTDSRPEAIYRPHGNFIGETGRLLRYWPVDGDFSITDGPEYFNRPLYCVNSAFRVDAGDKPEFSLYLPGRGGNLRLGVKTFNGTKWLNDADKIVARYQPGEMIYDIQDRCLDGAGVVQIHVLPLSDRKGFIVKAFDFSAKTIPDRNQFGAYEKSVELIWAFGGANGMKGSRGGDIGCEREPVSQFFQLKPEQCRSNEFTIADNTFTLRSRVGTIAGVASAGAKLAVAEAKKWNSPAELMAPLFSLTPGFSPVVTAKTTQAVSTALSNAPETVETVSSTTGSDTRLKPGVNEIELPVVVGEIALTNQPVYLAIQTTGEGVQVLRADELPAAFAAAEEHRRAIAERVTVETPDEFVNAAVPALNIAADGIWDAEQQAYMHGAVAWRQRLLGWRGPYVGDELGWHERTAAHFAGYAKNQNTDAIPDKIPPADEQFNLARNEAALHSNGDLMNRSHYDMNLVAVDAFFRHLLWTCDTNFARLMWPVIQRHLAWERRLFRREFGEDKLPLYEAYAAIWASDDLNYNGGGTTHASAYNYWHNKMAARVATILGEDATPYEQEADLILRGMRKYLWVPDEGMFAEYKDYLGLQLVHPNAGLWSFYHTMDSEVPSPEEAAQMAKWIDQNIAHIPVAGANVPDEKQYVLPETSWMPYQWSLNNVVVAENMHTALGLWQANRRDAAFPLFKGALLDTMFTGQCPGNIGCMTSHDMARGEAQRDFGDGIGTTARALVEGLFGVRPDALAGELKIAPGFPADWDHAKMKHPDFNFEFQREGTVTPIDTYVIESKFPRPMSLLLEVPAMSDWAGSVEVNDRRAKTTRIEDAMGARLQIRGSGSGPWTVRIEWRENAPQKSGRDTLALTSGKNMSTKEARDGDVALPLTPALSPGERENRSQSLGKAGMAGGSVSAAQGFDWKKKAVGTFETVDLASSFNDKVTQIFRNEYRSPRSEFCSLATPKQGIGGWCEPNASFDVDDAGLRAAAAVGGDKIVLPNGVPLATPGAADAKNIAFVSQWDNYPHEVSVPLTGKASHAFLLMAGSTSAMVSRLDNGEVVVAYTDGTSARLALNNPVNWWPIDQDYFIDDYAFKRPEAIPPRVDLATGKVRILDATTFKGQGGKVRGGAATVLDLALDPAKELKSVTVRALVNEVVIGVMSVTLVRE